MTMTDMSKYVSTANFILWAVLMISFSTPPPSQINSKIFHLIGAILFMYIMYCFQIRSVYISLFQNTITNLFFNL